MKESLVYLAGPIKGLSFDGSTSWRNQVTSKFPSNIIGVSPMRSKGFLGKEKKIVDSYEEFPLASSRGITCRDRFDVMRCDLLLINMLEQYSSKDHLSIGTIMEIGWGDAFRKPMILVSDVDEILNHPMVREAVPYKVGTLDEAALLTIQILSTGEV